MSAILPVYAFSDLSQISALACQGFGRGR